MNTKLQTKLILIGIVLSQFIIPTVHAHTGEMNLNFIIEIWHTLSHGLQLPATATHFAWIPATLSAISVFTVATFIRWYQQKKLTPSFFTAIYSSLVTFGFVGYLA